MLADRLPTVLRQVPLVRYDTTESGLDISNSVGDPRRDTIRVPLPSVMARIRAADRLADPGTDSEIQLRGPHVFAGHWNDPAVTEATFAHDGWFAPAISGP